MANDAEQLKLPCPNCGRRVTATYVHGHSANRWDCPWPGCSAVCAALTDMGIEATAIDRVQAIVSDSRFAKNDNRSLLGSVNDVAWHVRAEIGDEQRITVDLLRRTQKRLNRMPHVHREPSFPDQAVRRLFGHSIERPRR